MSEERVYARPGEHVAVGVISSATVTAHFARCLSDLFLWDAHVTKQNRFGHLRPQSWNIGTTLIHKSRNENVRNFLERSEADWLFFIDTDQTFDADILERLLDVADPDERPVIGVPVPCLKMDDPTTRRATLGHNVFAAGPAPEGFDVPFLFTPFEDLPLGTDSLVQCAAVGTGVMLVHRTVFDKIAAWVTEHGFGTHWCWFQSPVYRPQLAEGEDMYFARMCAYVGVPQFAHCGIPVGHVKSIVLDQFDMPLEGLSV
jgi:hypothetical protein